MTATPSGKDLVTLTAFLATPVRRNPFCLPARATVYGPIAWAHPLAPNLGCTRSLLKRFANVGNLDEPLTKSEYENRQKRLPAQLFAHNTQTRFAQNGDARTSTRVDGVLGRMLDGLSAAGASIGSYSISGTSPTVLEPVESIPFDVLRYSGVTRIDSTHAALLEPYLKEMTGLASASPFANTWSSLVGEALNRTAQLADALDNVTLAQTFAGTSGNNLALQLEQVAKLIRANQQQFHNEREAYYVTIGGFDNHANVIDAMELLLDQVDAALGSFEAEMKLQGLWDNVLVVESSEFARTITSNGDGSDHAWGGNYFLAGGAVRGGQILGQFPEDLGEEGEFNLGRGRLLPTTSWEHVWSAVAEWFGVPESSMDAVLPRRGNFPGLYSAADVFSS